MIRLITSTHNKLVKQWKKLHTKKHRQSAQQFIIEGEHLLEEAYKSGWEIETIIVVEKAIVPGWAEQIPQVLVSRQVFREISQTETPQGISAVVHMQKPQPITGDYILLLDAVQDPGNVGTMIRTADAAGFSGVIIGTGSVDLYNDKVIRASQGSIFHIPVVQGDLANHISNLKKADFTIVASALEQAQPLPNISRLARMALIVGNEGAGIHPEILTTADTIVKIPIYGRAESLNVSVAAGILMYSLRKKSDDCE